MVTDFDDFCLWTYVIVDDMLISSTEPYRSDNVAPPQPETADFQTNQAVD